MLRIKKSISRGSSVPAYRIDNGEFSHFVSSRLSSSRLETLLPIMADMEYTDCSNIVKKNWLKNITITLLDGSQSELI